MACNCKNKLNNYIDVSKIKENDWEEINSVVAMDECGNIVIAEKPDTLIKDDRKKINSIKIKGKGEKALYDDGEYKHTYTADQTDTKLENYSTKEEIEQKLEKFDDYYTKQQTDENISAALEDYYTKEQTDKNISTNLEDYYSKEEINSTLQNAVFFDQDNNIILNENNKIIAKQTNLQEKKTFNVIETNTWDRLDIGSLQVNLNLNSKNRPSVKTNQSQEAQNIAFLSDIQKTEENLQNQIDDVNTEIKENNNDLNQFKQETNNSISELDQKIEGNSKNIALNSSDIKTLREEFNAAEHFKGYFQTIDEITSLPAEKGAFAWCAETATVWVYEIEQQNEMGSWKNSNNSIPDQTVAPFQSLPLMDGEAQAGTVNLYARGDHRHPADDNKADKEELETISEKVKDNYAQLENFKENTNNSFESINTNIKDIQKDVCQNKKDITLNTADITSLRNDFNAAEHFKGYFQTINEITLLPGEQGAFAWCAETGTVWIYNTEHENGSWINADILVPDQTVLAYDAFPLMDGNPEPGTSNLYARGDHRHPADQNKADKNDLDNYLPLAGNSKENKITGDIWLGTENQIKVSDLGTSYLKHQENTQTTILKGEGGGGIDLQTPNSTLKYNGKQIATTDQLQSSEDKAKVDMLITNGDGYSYLANDGTYKEAKGINGEFLPITGGTVEYLNINSKGTDDEDKRLGAIYFTEENPKYPTHAYIHFERNEANPYNSGTLSIVTDNTLTGPQLISSYQGGILNQLGLRYDNLQDRAYIDIQASIILNENATGEETIGNQEKPFDKIYINKIYINNFDKTEEINTILLNGEGDKFLADDGKYKKIELDYLPLEGGTLTGTTILDNSQLIFNNDTSNTPVRNITFNNGDTATAWIDTYDAGLVMGTDAKLALNSETESITLASAKDILLIPKGFAKYKDAEIATKDDIITKRDGNGDQFLNDKGEYKKVYTSTQIDEKLVDYISTNQLDSTLTNYVTTDTTQTITGGKTFSETIIANKSITIPLNTALVTTDSQGNTYPLIEMSNNKQIFLGGENSDNHYPVNITNTPDQTTEQDSTLVPNIGWVNTKLETFGKAYLPLSGGILTGALTSIFANSFRIVNGDYGTFWRHDGSHLYLMLTQEGDPYGTFNNLKPFYINLSTGAVTMGTNVNISSILSTSSITNKGNITLTTTPEQTTDKESTLVPNIGWVNTRVENFGNAYLSLSGGTLTGALTSIFANSFRIAVGDYGTFWRHDGSYLYLMITQEGDPYGTFNNLRPFYINLSTGAVTMGTNVNISYINIIKDGNITLTTAPAQTTSKDSTLVPNIGWVNTRIEDLGNTYLPLTGGRMTGDIVMQNNKLDLGLSGNIYLQAVTNDGLTLNSSTGIVLNSVNPITANNDINLQGGITIKDNAVIRGNVTATGSYITDSSYAIRMRYGDYGVLHRNDGAKYHIMLTDAGSPSGGYNSLRPFSMDLATGKITMSTDIEATELLTANTLTVNHTSTFAKRLTANGGIKTPVASGLYGTTNTGTEFNLITVDTGNNVLLGGTSQTNYPVHIHNSLYINGKARLSNTPSQSEENTVIPNIGWVNTKLDNLGVGTQTYNWDTLATKGISCFNSASTGTVPNIGEAASWPGFSSTIIGSPSYSLQVVGRLNRMFFRNSEIGKLQEWKEVATKDDIPNLTNYVTTSALDTKLNGYATTSALNSYLPSSNFTAANVLAKLNENTAIGITKPTTFTQFVTCEQGAGTNSDIRFKRNIQPLENSLETIENLDLFLYDWEKEDGNLVENQIGVSAQQLKESYPELVHQMDDERQTYSVDYARLIVPALKAIQELSAKIKSLEKELSELKQQLNS